MGNRGPLRFIILAATGEDVNDCIACDCCTIDDALLVQFDMPIYEVLAAARQNDCAALTNQTIWVLAQARSDEVHCVNGLDPVAIARVLCHEAQLRGFAPGFVKNTN